MIEHEIELEDGSKIVLNNNGLWYDARQLLQDHFTGRLKIKEYSVELLYDLAVKKVETPKKRKKAKKINIRIDGDEFIIPPVSEDDARIRAENTELTKKFKMQYKLDDEKRKQDIEDLAKNHRNRPYIEDLIDLNKILDDVEADQEIENLKG
jgi:hypothetical protein